MLNKRISKYVIWLVAGITFIIALFVLQQEDEAVLELVTTSDAPVTNLAFSPDGAMLAISTSAESGVMVWSIETGELSHTLDGWESVGWQRGEEMPLSANTVIEEYVDTQARYSRSAAENTIWSPDRRILAIIPHSSDNRFSSEVLLVDAETGKQIRVLPGNHKPFDTCNSPRCYYPASHIVFSQDESKSAVVQHLVYDAGTDIIEQGAYNVNLWNLETDEKIKTLDATDIYSSLNIAFSPDSSLLAIGGIYLEYIVGKRVETHTGGKVFIFDAQTGEELNTFEHTLGLSSMVWSPDGTLLALGMQNGVTIVWQATP